MAETSNLTLPLLAAGQAQKHVTVNEALSRLDLLVMLAVKSRTLAAPPASPAEGDRYAVPAGGQDAWAGRDQMVAAFLNGGWDFIQPFAGWRAFVEDEGAEVTFAAGVWTELTAPTAGSGEISVLEFEHAIGAGGAQETTGLIPAGSIVFGVTARIVEAVTGASGWSLGVPGAETRYGTGYGTDAGLGLRCVTGAPLAYPQDIPLTLTPEGGDFTGGRIRFNIHRLLLEPPD